jgi:spore germination protein
VQRGETLSGIAERYGLMTPTLMKINKISNPRSLRPGQTLLLSREEATVHTVKRGETLGKIAQKYGVSVSALAKENKISIKTTLRVGQHYAFPPAGRTRRSRPWSGFPTASNRATT